ncbi:MAG: hypothetical protein OJF52_004349 [Nitrospira sp.]|nr:MAG: hypothetical protein OJF52_004349 [Nitrospira sp.]
MVKIKRQTSRGSLRRPSLIVGELSHAWFLLQRLNVEK